MGNGALTGKRYGGHGWAGEGYVVDMLHGAHGGTDVADASPAVGAEALLEHGHHGVEECVDVGGDGAVLGSEAYGDGVAASGCLYAVKVGGADAYKVGADGVFNLPDGELAAIVADGTAL